MLPLHGGESGEQVEAMLAPIVNKQHRDVAGSVTDGRLFPTIHHLDLPNSSVRYFAVHDELDDWMNVTTDRGERIRSIIGELFFVFGFRFWVFDFSVQCSVLTKCILYSSQHGTCSCRKKS